MHSISIGTAAAPPAGMGARSAGSGPPIGLPGFGGALIESLPPVFRRDARVPESGTGVPGRAAAAGTNGAGAEKLLKKKNQPAAPPAAERGSEGPLPTSAKASAEVAAVLPVAGIQPAEPIDRVADRGGVLMAKEAAPAEIRLSIPVVAAPAAATAAAEALPARGATRPAPADAAPPLGFGGPGAEGTPRIAAWTKVVELSGKPEAESGRAGSGTGTIAPGNRPVPRGWSGTEPTTFPGLTSTGDGPRGSGRLPAVQGAGGARAVAGELHGQPLSEAGEAPTVHRAAALGGTPDGLQSAPGADSANGNETTPISGSNPGAPKTLDIKGGSAIASGAAAGVGSEPGSGGDSGPGLRADPGPAAGERLPEAAGAASSPPGPGLTIPDKPAAKRAESGRAGTEPGPRAAAAPEPAPANHSAGPAHGPAVAGPAVRRDPAPAVAPGESFRRIDSGPAPPSGSTRSAARVVEVGVDDPTHGWLEIRAQGASGRVAASLNPASPEAHAALHAQLSGMAGYLAERELGVRSLTVAGGAGDGRSEQAGHERPAGQDGQAGQERQAGGGDSGPAGDRRPAPEKGLESSREADRSGARTNPQAASAGGRLPPSAAHLISVRA